jgi:hypothetical protein
MKPAHLLANRFQIAAPEGFSAGHVCPAFTQSGLAGGWNRRTRFHQSLISCYYATGRGKNQQPMATRLLQLGRRLQDERMVKSLSIGAILSDTTS